VATEGGAAAAASYYGDVKLHFLPAPAPDGAPPPAASDCLVPLPKDGPVHDVAWSPRGDSFVAVAGYMPARTTVFDAHCRPRLDLGSGPHALARWSPHGRFLALAGFGNLAGDVAFFDRKADGKLKPCGAARVENGVSAEWAPDGRTLLVATTAPRLRVDNGLRLVKYDGALVAAKPYPVLLEARWRPTPSTAFPDRPPSPRAAGADGAPKPPVTAKAARPAAFVPPHLRGQPGAARAARAVLGHNSDDESGPRKIASVIAAGRAARLPPGAGPAESKAASKNAKRRAAAAAKKKAEGGGGA
jgi:translation initiation factor 2A